MRILSALMVAGLLVSMAPALGDAATFSKVQVIRSTPRRNLIAPTRMFLPGSISCPAVVSKKPILFPTPPYDPEVGDCALRGRGAEIEAYLQDLERIAADCREGRQAAWDLVQEQQEAIDAAIDRLPSPPPPPPPPPPQKEEEEDDGFRLSTLSTVDPLPPMPRMCSSAAGSSGSLDSLGGRIPGEDQIYTDWLQRITENVRKYCTMISELIDPIAEACTEIREESQCMMDDPAQGGVSDGMITAFHNRLSGAMNAATIKNEYLAFFYDHTLLVTGFGNFRQYFNEENIECAGSTLMPTPAYINFRNALPTITGLSQKSQRESLSIKGRKRRAKRKTPKREQRSGRRLIEFLR